MRDFIRVTSAFIVIAVVVFAAFNFVAIMY